jgi:ABC-type glycerol-3-phosphate transport system substrate-binding protein
MKKHLMWAVYLLMAAALGGCGGVDTSTAAAATQSAPTAGSTPESTSITY